MARIFSRERIERHLGQIPESARQLTPRFLGEHYLLSKEDSGRLMESLLEGRGFHREKDFETWEYAAGAYWSGKYASLKTDYQRGELIAIRRIRNAQKYKPKRT